MTGREAHSNSNVRAPRRTSQIPGIARPPTAAARALGRRQSSGVETAPPAAGYTTVAESARRMGRDRRLREGLRSPARRPDGHEMEAGPDPGGRRRSRGGILRPRRALRELFTGAGRDQPDGLGRPGGADGGLRRLGALRAPRKRSENEVFEVAYRDLGGRDRLRFGLRGPDPVPTTSPRSASSIRNGSPRLPSSA